jgi:hypothetical protein
MALSNLQHEFPPLQQALLEDFLGFCRIRQRQDLLQDRLELTLLDEPGNPVEVELPSFSQYRDVFSAG